MTDQEQLKEVEKRLAKLELTAAVDVEKTSNIITRIERVESILSKLVWLMVTVIVAGLLKFIMDGGLVVTP